MSYDEYESPIQANKLRLVLRNRVLHFFFVHLGIIVSIGLVFGLNAVKFQLAYSFVGIFFIELINYVEHYGLVRQKDQRGIYEPISERHSWNAVSSHLLFRIQRHSDHHMHWYKPYQILKRIDSAPQMPFDYLYTMLLALCPPLWYETVNPRLNQGAKSDPSRLVYTYFVVCIATLLGIALKN